MGLFWPQAGWPRLMSFGIVILAQTGWPRLMSFAALNCFRLEKERQPGLTCLGQNALAHRFSLELEISLLQIASHISYESSSYYSSSGARDEVTIGPPFGPGRRITSRVRTLS